MLTREQLSQKIIVTSYLNVAANVLNESTFSSSILNTINPSSATARDLSHVLLFIFDEIRTVTIDAVKGMQEAFVRPILEEEATIEYSSTAHPRSSSVM